MKESSQQDWVSQKGLNRQVIQVETPESRAGIAAALRRAFEAAATEPSDHDFAALLARLN